MKFKNIIFFLAATAIMAVIMALPIPYQIQTNSGVIALTVHGKAALAVLAMVVALWITEAVPFPIAGLIGMVLLVVTGAADFATLVRNGFGNPIIMFFLGMLLFSVAIGETNLLRRVTTYLLYHLGHKPKAVILIFIVIGAMLSFWIVEMAVAAMLLPIGVSILKGAGVKPRESNFGRALMIACAWGPMAGGVATPAGCGPNPLTISFLKDLAGVNITFLDWMILGVPAAILMVPCAWLILIWIFPIEKDVNLTLADNEFREKLREMGRLKKNEICTMVIFGLTVFLWMCAPWIEKWSGGAIGYLGVSYVAVACSCLFFLPGIEIVSWKKAESEISWGGIVLIASGMSVGMAVYDTGAAAWMAQVAFSRLGDLSPVMIVFAVVFGVSLMKVLFSSNTVTGIIMVPLLIALAKNIGLHSTLVAIPAGITASLAFILVTSTPTSVIPYSSGYFSIRDMAKAGVWMTIAACACVTISIVIFGRMSGIVKF